MHLTYAWHVACFLHLAAQRKNLQKIEKASRKSRKRKTATYKEEEISHSSDLDSTTDDEAEVVKLLYAYLSTLSYTLNAKLAHPDMFTGLVFAAGIKGEGDSCSPEKTFRRGRF